MQHKPRNPLVPAMMRRSGAGAHGKSGKAKRLVDRNTLRHELHRRNDAASVPRIAVH